MFITVEGGEGSGKSTVLNYVYKKLTHLGYRVLLTREPGGIMISERIRDIILHPNHDMMDAKTEVLLYAAARRQHLVEKIKPALNEGKIVLCDRFIDSSLAYQGYARKLNIDEVLKINEFVIDNYMPSLTLFFDVKPEIGLNRIVNNNREQNRLDLESLQFHYRVYEGYQLLLKRYPNRIRKIEASKELSVVKQEAFKLISSHIEDFIEEVCK